MMNLIYNNELKTSEKEHPAAQSSNPCCRGSVTADFPLVKCVITVCPVKCLIEDWTLLNFLALGVEAVQCTYEAKVANYLLEEFVYLIF